MASYARHHGASPRHDAAGPAWVEGLRQSYVPADYDGGPTAPPKQAVPYGLATQNHCYPAHSHQMGPTHASAQLAPHADVHVPSGGLLVSQTLYQGPGSMHHSSGAVQQYPDIHMTASGPEQKSVPASEQKYPAVHGDRTAHTRHRSLHDSTSSGLFPGFDGYAAQPAAAAYPGAHVSPRAPMQLQPAHTAAAQALPLYGESSELRSSSQLGGIFRLPSQQARPDNSARSLAHMSLNSTRNSGGAYPMSPRDSSIPQPAGAYMPPVQGHFQVPHTDSMRSDKTQAGSTYNTQSSVWYPDTQASPAGGPPQQATRAASFPSPPGPPPPMTFPEQQQDGYAGELTDMFNLKGLQIDTVSTARVTDQTYLPAIPAPVPPPVPAQDAHDSDDDSGGLEVDGGRRRLKRALKKMAEQSRPFAQKYYFIDGTESGGQALVAFARGEDNKQFAIKLFDDLEDMREEEALYRDPVLRDVLPALVLASTNQDGSVRGPGSFKFPPFLVLERGQPMKQWCKTKRNFFDVCGMLQGLAQLVATLHANGRVHRDLKPDNVLLMLNDQTWRLLDLGIVEEAGKVAWPACTPAYAPPETVLAVFDSNTPKPQRRIEVQPSHDSWALGVMAFEALTGRSAFRGPSEVLRCAKREQCYAWELPADEQPKAWRKSVLRGHVADCLHRDPSKRPSAAELDGDLGGIGMMQTECMKFTAGKRQEGVRR